LESSKITEPFSFSQYLLNNKRIILFGYTKSFCTLLVESNHSQKMTINRSSVFLEVIESLSKSPYINEGDDLAMAKEILYNATNFLKISRANSWIMKEDSSGLECLLAYDLKTETFNSEGELNEKNFPFWFNHINRNDIIISSDARKEPFNKELLDNYLIPLNIYSMMEVPILSGGKLKGIVCFENTENLREWSNDEQHFALALTQLLTLTLETKEKNIYRDELEKMVKEKTILIAEINHRVKNNLAVMTALIRSESNRSKDNYHKQLFENLLSKSFSLSTLQSAMYQSQNYKEVNFSEFIKSLIGNLNNTYGHNLNVRLNLKLSELYIDISNAIPCSLIINEIFTNAYKYAFKEGRENILSIELLKNSIDKTQIIIKDNGPGLKEDYKSLGTGFDLITGLAEQIDGDLGISTSNQGTEIILSF
jgi:two-component sensor histidine kinase